MENLFISVRVSSDPFLMGMSQYHQRGNAKFFHSFKEINAVMECIAYNMSYKDEHWVDFEINLNGYFIIEVFHFFPLDRKQLASNGKIDLLQYLEDCLKQKIEFARGMHSSGLRFWKKGFSRLRKQGLGS